jgi:hypothetical protein
VKFKCICEGELSLCRPRKRCVQSAEQTEQTCQGLWTDFQTTWLTCLSHVSSSPFYFRYKRMSGSGLDSRAAILSRPSPHAACLGHQWVPPGTKWALMSATFTVCSSGSLSAEERLILLSLRQGRSLGHRTASSGGECTNCRRADGPGSTHVLASCLAWAH